ncbi:hypothetical protein N7492_007568 [Penicillium capsulatum]|uniref:Major facilitator superfamily (MFS) profile domain-containing protein n=1 Tax=Penicillium capsulatum TaxID=69766 RepID=A0A9W9I280_9EURO|nr:hypothetical protein N7492_007568 [Penicillium capsulatum]KAJ6117402.1 hypothetical protein N7512_007127 [Penicillium capsulatum]
MPSGDSNDNAPPPYVEVEDKSPAKQTESLVFGELPAEHSKILRKIDYRVIPILAVLYLLSFLDRGNIGNANIQGMSTDIGLVGQQYNWCLTIFFFPYSFTEPICNVLLVKLKPSIWLPSIMVAWGIVMTLTGLVRNYSGLLAARFFLGLTEAGLFPGLAFYVSLWWVKPLEFQGCQLIPERYPRSNAQFRLSLIFASASMAGAFSGLLAYLISKMNGVGGLEGWRWIFVLEGLLTVVVAMFAYFLVWDEPATATFLSDHEKGVIIGSLNYTQAETSLSPRMGNEHSFKWKHVAAAILDWQTWFHCIEYWGMACAVYALSLFLPAIIKGLGYSSAIAQLLTIPIYAAATISCIVVGYYSDKTGQRSFFTLGCYVAVFVGYIIAVAPAKFLPGLTYAGCFIAACGIYPAIPGLLALSSNNWAPNAKRAVGMAIQMGFGTMGGAAASNFYRSSDAPRYRLGHTLVLVFAALGLVTTVMYYLICRRINAKRESDADNIHGYSTEDLIDMGDKSPSFRYNL